MNKFSPETSFYLRGKMDQWKSEDGSIEKHVGILGSRNRLANEFSEDFEDELQSVCRDINTLGYGESRNEVIKIIGRDGGFFFTIPFLGKADVILGGLVDACLLRRRKDRIERW